MNLTEIEVEDLEVKSTSRGYVIKVNLIGVNSEEILEQIGKEECMKYFGLIEE